MLSGTPTGTSESATYTYTVTDADNNTANTDKDTLTFTIVVAADSTPAFASGAAIADQSLIRNSAMTSVTLPVATGGNGTLTYSLSPALPTGLSFTLSTRVLSGTPSVTKASTTYTYTVSDADSDTATLTFTITVYGTDSAPAFASGTSIANQALIQNSAMTSVTLPAATGGNGALSYSLSPSLPTGLSFDAGTRVLSGTPSATSASATYTYTVSDGDNNTANTDKATLTFTIVVDGTDSAPAFADNASIANQSLTQNSAMTSLTLPAATGGNGALSYSITPALPTGLSFNASTRALSGTPTAVSASTTYTYTVSDGDNNSASTDKDTITFTIVVTAAVTDTAPAFADDASIANQSLTQNSAMTDLTLPAATGGNGTLSYSISPALPTGLTFTASTRVLSGTPTGTSASATYTYTVSDGDENTADSDEDTLTFTIAVAAAVADTAPSFGSSTIANQSLTQNSAMTSLTLPAATGGNGTLTYSLSPALPTGLTFTASTRVLSGTPTGTSASATYTYTVSDGDENTASTDKDTLTFTIAVAAEPDTAPSFGSSTIANQSLTQNTAITDLTLPAATGGNGTLSYTLTPALPSGLSFTASTRVLSGTPAAAAASATYTYTVSDGDNNTASTDKDTLSFTIVVAADTAEGAPGKPTGFTVAPVKQAVVLKASATGSGITGWQYRHKRSGQDDSRYPRVEGLPVERRQHARQAGGHRHRGRGPAHQRHLRLPGARGQQQRQRPDFGRVHGRLPAVQRPHLRHQPRRREPEGGRQLRQQAGPVGRAADGRRHGDAGFLGGQWFHHRVGGHRPQRPGPPERTDLQLVELEQEPGGGPDLVE